MSGDAVFVELIGRTDIGLVRGDNQDSHIIGMLDDGERIESETPRSLAVIGRGPMLVVCDGMGGAAGGAVASKLAAKVIFGEMRAAQATEDRLVFARHLRRAVRLANRRVFEKGRDTPELRGMGTTVSAAGLVGNAVLLAQVGDSRAYIHRGSTLTQVTRDQSVSSALVHAGKLTPDEASKAMHSHMILQALGVEVDVEVSISIVEIRRGDTLLLCSDGLHGPVGDDRLRATMSACPDLDEAIETLIRLAHRAGAPDNITAVVARFGGEGLAPAMSEDDLPRFVEVNPLEEGERALATTSWVARRLAAKAGIGEDPGPAPIPATGQHPVYRGDALDPVDPAASYRGPAMIRLAERSRSGLVAWALAVVAVVAVGAFLLWDSL
ncbi:MAG TPA: protein phosphatase 2C domain-containing protein [Kofleriaceae bacterium]|nr:protein phosphatase 2C domain-containing protein [Kofleriaceae bacterium]